LDGVIQKLDYIKSLGTTILYLNPIFEARSNHKYDTSDYHKIDPYFGNLSTFKKLIKESNKRGIKVILDTSLNHSGADSKYMDRYGKYPDSLGAYENEKIRKDSKYYDWYEFKPEETNPDNRYNQWAVPSLANLKESKSYKQFAFVNKDSVMKYWLDKGISGWRMDVAPWVSDQFWREWRAEIKKDYKDAFTISEVWFDASKYFVGDMFDSTMNYIFRAAVLNFAQGKDAQQSVNSLEMTRENYPTHVFYRNMNLLSGHDLPRALWEVGYKSKKDSYRQARKRLKLAFILQYTMPGSPTLYYGDEVGMDGGHDPLNRKTYPWKEDGGNGGDQKLLAFTRKLAQFRKTSEALSKGSIKFISVSKHTIVFQRKTKNETLYIAVNNSTKPLNTTFITEKGRYQSLFNNEGFESSGKSKLRIPALGFDIYKKQ
jgi:glycosidase